MHCPTADNFCFAVEKHNDQGKPDFINEWLYTDEGGLFCHYLLSNQCSEGYFNFTFGFDCVIDADGCLH